MALKRETYTSYCTCDTCCSIEFCLWMSRICHDVRGFSLGNETFITTGITGFSFFFSFIYRCSFQVNSGFGH
jgi:hypothetical protein